MKAPLWLLMLANVRAMGVEKTLRVIIADAGAEVLRRSGADALGVTHRPPVGPRERSCFTTRSLDETRRDEPRRERKCAPSRRWLPGDRRTLRRLTPSQQAALASAALEGMMNVGVARVCAIVLNVCVSPERGSLLKKSRLASLRRAWVVRCSESGLRVVPSRVG